MLFTNDKENKLAIYDFLAYMQLEHGDHASHRCVLSRTGATAALPSAAVPIENAPPKLAWQIFNSLVETHPATMVTAPY